MPTSAPAAFALVSVLVLAACTPSGIAMDRTAASPEYRRNPNPTQAYALTMRIEDAPGPFAQMVGLAQYDVVTPECLPPPNANPGGHTSAVPTVDLEIPLTRAADGTYTGTVHADAMVDEDYHGRGVCRWKLIQARVHMKATGDAEETLFIPRIMGEPLMAGASQTVYFARSLYPAPPDGGFAYSGETDRAKFNSRIEDADLFTVQFSVRSGVR